MTVVYTPSAARSHWFEILRQVNEQRQPVEIRPASGAPGAVVIAAEDWASIQETLYLETTGTLERVRERAADSSGVTDIDDIDWDSL
ncbi:MAG: type II toxin-antitoxin system prevent-host-death family antitoxin [Bifidobacteriaceae bacterium]|nr:type II toxin-antitoxin system prevent-host-death family antitoxin [Bifidobacteriaceae bacterium]